MAKTMEELTADYEALEQKMKSAKERVAELEREKIAGDFSGNSDEKRLLRTFRSGNVKSLLEKNVMAPEFAGASVTDKLAVLELKKEIDIARWYAQMFNNAPKDRGEMEKSADIARVKLFDTKHARETDLQGRLKAFGTGSAGEGAEWIETLISSNYVDEYMLEKRVANAFADINMPSNPFKLPVKSGSKTARIVNEGAAATDKTFTTSAITFDAEHKLVELYNLPEELNEDSAVAFLSLGRQGVLESQIAAIETAILNGDVTPVHMDGALDADDARRMCMGLRKAALANAGGAIVDFSAAAISATKLDEMLALGGKFMLNPREALFIVSAQGSHQMTALPEVTSVEKFGPMATILSGYLNAFRGRPIVASEYMPENLTAGGVAGGALGGLLLVNKTRWYLAHRRPIKVRVAADSRAEYDRWQLVSYQRADFKGHTQSASEKSVIYGVNVNI
jgi:HK97 family phage major capsid protein